MKRPRNQRHERICLALLLALLAGWFAMTLVAMPKTSVRTINVSWGHYVNQLYADTVDGLNDYATNRWDSIGRLVVLPITGEPLSQHNFCSPRVEGLVQLLRTSEELNAPPEKQIVAAKNLKSGDLAIQVHLASFSLRIPERPREFRASMDVNLKPFESPAVPLIEDRIFQGSNAMLPWFVQTVPGPAARLAWKLASVALILFGALFGTIYYRLVNGAFIGPRRLAGPINALRASTGLIASSLVFLTGVVSLLLISFLAPTTGETLNPRRLHVDLLLETSEPVLPTLELGRPGHALHEVSRSLAGELVAGLARELSEKQNQHRRIEPGVWTNLTPWIREELPRILRSKQTEIRFTGGATWQVFGVSGDEVAAPFDGMQWLPASREDRHEAIDDAFDAAKQIIPQRSTVIPLPWDEEKVPQLDHQTLVTLRAGRTGPESMRFARILFSTFHHPSEQHLQHWIRTTRSKSDDERIYSVVLPSLPRSSQRYWETVEGKLLSARSVADRVVTLHTPNGSLTENDPRLSRLTEAPLPGLKPDFALPLFTSGGATLTQLSDYSRPRDLEQSRAALFSTPTELTERARGLADDFQTWFFGSGRDIEEISVFTIPRSPIYALTIILGLIFIIAGLRTETYAQGLGPIMPPAVLVMSAVVWPMVAAGWVFSRADTGRFVIFGYADLAFWGVCYIWFCLVVVPLFGGRLRAGLQPDLWMWISMISAVLLASVMPLIGDALRPQLAGACLTGVMAASSIALVLRRVFHHRFGGMDATLLLFIAIAVAYRNIWPASSQDVPALYLAAFFLVMIASGWRRGLAWWRIESRPAYDRISWLQPFNRLILGMLLTLAGAAVLYCSFPVTETASWIRGYNSYCMALCVLPFLICALALVLVDLTQKQIT
ncbi:MAG: hypothetical protein AAF492_02000 [Verrucomicrobiota bacterium]